MSEVRIAGTIDRSKWATERRDAIARDLIAVTLDGHDAGFVFPEPGGRWLPMLTDNEPFDGRTPPSFETVEAAVEWVKAEWTKWWAYCSECGGPTTEEDREYAGLHVPVAADCAACRAEISGGLG
jgi:hypothetical protein